MWEAATALVMFGVFLGIYELLRRRAPGGSRPPVRWGWLAAITLAAALAFVIGLVTR